MSTVDDFEARVRRRWGVSSIDLALMQRWAGELRARGWAPASVDRACARVAAFAKATTTRGRGLLSATKDDLYAFVKHRAAARALTVAQLLTTPTWRKSVNAFRAFYASVEARGLIAHVDVPVHGLMTPPTGQDVPPIGVKTAQLYHRVLHVAGLSARDRAVLLLLAHGFTVQEVTALELEDVDPQRCEVRIRRGASTWPAPATATAMTALTRWLAVRATTSAVLLFPGHHGHRATGSMIRHVVQRAALLAFPHGQQRAKRRAISASGFRRVYLRRVIRSRLSPDTLATLTRFADFRSIRRYAVDRDTQPRAHAELRRLARHWRGWI